MTDAISYQSLPFRPPHVGDYAGEGKDYISSGRNKKANAGALKRSGCHYGGWGGKNGVGNVKVYGGTLCGISLKGGDNKETR